MIQNCVRNPEIQCLSPQFCQVTFASLLVLEILCRINIQGCRKFWCGLEALKNQHCAICFLRSSRFFLNEFLFVFFEWSLCFCIFWNQKQSRQDFRSASIVFSTEAPSRFAYEVSVMGNQFLRRAGAQTNLQQNKS